jgi:hypothetical protein
MNFSYFDENAQRVNTAASRMKIDVDMELLKSYMTISDFRNLLLDHSANLADDFTESFMNDVMLVDFNKAIRNIRNYTGQETKGIIDAQKKMDIALEWLYTALYYAKEEKAKQQAKALIKCRDALDKAYRFLEHLESAKKQVENLNIKPS